MINYAILHNENKQRIIEMPNFDLVPVLIDYALENGMQLSLYISEIKVFRKLKEKFSNNEIPFTETKDPYYEFEEYTFRCSEKTVPDVFFTKTLEYVPFEIEKSL